MHFEEKEAQQLLIVRAGRWVVVLSVWSGLVWSPRGIVFSASNICTVFVPYMNYKQYNACISLRGEVTLNCTVPALYLTLLIHSEQ